jgi:hypothetical protein
MTNEDQGNTGGTGNVTQIDAGNNGGSRYSRRGFLLTALGGAGALATWYYRDTIGSQLGNMSLPWTSDNSIQVNENHPYAHGLEIALNTNDRKSAEELVCSYIDSLPKGDFKIKVDSRIDAARGLYKALTSDTDVEREGKFVGMFEKSFEKGQAANEQFRIYCKTESGRKK